MREVRAFSYLLHPPLLDEAGLAMALRWYLDGFAQRTNIQVLSDITNVGRLSSDQEIALFRIAQESMTNVHRHARCSECRVQLARSDDLVTLQISDNGKGLDGGAPAGAQVGVGLRGMQERIEQLGGRFEISSTAEGTRVKASLPISACAEPSQDD
jgi:signal transduction histidine kinase